MERERSDARRYGLILPHFGRHAARAALIDIAPEIERLGFDSVWVRDHIMYHPHQFEDQDRTFVEPMVVLSAVAAVTKRLVLATGSLIPHRHPIHAAQVLASLAFVAGPDRVIAGWGLGAFDHEFAAVGLGSVDRSELLPEQISIMRALWTGQLTSHKGKHYDFADVEVHPAPPSPIPIWYCGPSLKAVDRAVDHCDGWIPGGMPRTEYRKRFRRLHSLAAKAARQAPLTGVIPFVVPGATTAEARDKVPAGFVANAMRRFTPPPGGFRGPEDSEGGVIAGTPDDIVREVEMWHAAGADLFVFDLRACFAEWEESVALIGREVLPRLRSAGACGVGADRG